MSTLCRRERLQAAQELDTRIATTLHGFTRAHQRQETLEALQCQARAMPEVTAQMQALMAQMERQNGALNAQLLARQEGFHRQAEAAYAGLADSVDQTLRRTLEESVGLAGAAMQPVVEATMAGVASASTALHDRLALAVQTQFEDVSLHLRHATAALQTEWVESDRQRLAAYTQSLNAMAAALQSEWQEAGERTRVQQEQICQTLEQTAQDIHTQAQLHARNTISELAGLMQTVAEAPRAAAEVMAELRMKLSDSLVRDNALLEERSHILATVNSLLDAVQQGASEQRGAIDALVAQAANLLHSVGTQFTSQVSAETQKISAVAAQVTGSAVEVASLGEAFGHGVQLFTASNEGLMANLQRIESALNKSMLRSDEQLAYYVAQAREIIDLSILSQRQIVEDLQRMAKAPAASAAREVG